MADRQSAALRRDYIDILKGLGILLVVFGHFMEQYPLGSHLIGATFISIYWFHMALFCMCSGLVALFSLGEPVTERACVRRPPPRLIRPCRGRNVI